MRVCLDATAGFERQFSNVGTDCGLQLAATRQTAVLYILSLYTVQMLQHQTLQDATDSVKFCRDKSPLKYLQFQQTWPRHQLIRPSTHSSPFAPDYARQNAHSSSPAVSPKLLVPTVPSYSSNSTRNSAKSSSNTHLPTPKPKMPSIPMNPLLSSINSPVRPPTTHPLRTNAANKPQIPLPSPAPTCTSR